MSQAVSIRSLAVLAVLCLSAPAVAAETGHTAGFAEASVVDPASGQRAPVSLWYPTQAPETAVRRGPYTLRVAEGAPIAKGRFGLVVLSHGSGGSPITMRGTAAYLARHGYVVAAPLHPLNNFRDNSGPSSRVVLEGRPRTLSKTIDLVLGDLALGGRSVAKTIDRRRIAALGYSAGGAAVLALAGAVPVRHQAVAHCNRFKDDPFCRFITPAYARASRTPITGLADTRIAAIVVIAPVSAWYDDKALRRIRKPMLILVAAKDGVLSVKRNGHRVRHFTRGEVRVLTVPKAGHFVFLTPFPPALRDRLPRLAKDPPGVDRVRVHAAFNRAIVAFLDRTLK